MFAIDQLNREAAERARRDRIYEQNKLIARLIKGCFFFLLTLAFMTGFAVFGWTAVNVTPDPAVIPTWLWRGTFGFTSIGLLISSGYAMFATLDEVFLSRDDTRRILRKHASSKRK